MRLHLLVRTLVGAVLGALLAPAPAFATTAPELIVSGGGLDRPVHVTVEDPSAIGAPVRGRAGGAPTRTGRRYDLDVLRLSLLDEGATQRWSRTVEGRWTYYPEAGGALDEDGSWVPFAPALRRLIDRRIGEAGVAGGGIGLPVVAGLVGAAFGAGLLARRLTGGRADRAPVTSLPRPSRPAPPAPVRRPPAPPTARRATARLVALPGGRSTGQPVGRPPVGESRSR